MYVLGKANFYALRAADLSEISLSFSLKVCFMNVSFEYCKSSYMCDNLFWYFRLNSPACAKFPVHTATECRRYSLMSTKTKQQQQQNKQTKTTTTTTKTLSLSIFIISTSKSSYMGIQTLSFGTLGKTLRPILNF